MNILIVEDNDIIAHGLEYYLTNEGFKIHINSTSNEAKNTIKNNKFNLIILDISLPDGNGFDLCKYIKEENDTPIIFLTAYDEEKDIVKAFDLGAEDYIVKPFRNRELLSRINNVLRHHNSNNNIIENGRVRIDIDSSRVFVDNSEVILTALEYKILLFLYSNLNSTITRDMILEKIWDVAGNYVNDNTLTVYIKRLREKLNIDDIITIKGIGYRVNKHE
ncbi:MAG TPA: response regulator transcription factor [Bacilli bacterium]|nr:response regulator transcription factor [Bacilli bacterium]HQC83831.1 response regulator transcription factor [Bacilli bacterium]